MFGCTSIPSIVFPHSWEQADKLFEKPAPRGAAWRDYQRPLYNNRSWHYRVERGDDGAYYDLCLYHTSMIRYHKPYGDGTHRVEVRGYNSTASWEFLWRNGFSRVTPVGGRLLPLSCNPKKGLFSASLLYEGSKVLFEDSYHDPAFTRYSTKEDKEKRAELLAMNEVNLNLACVNLSDRDSPLEYNPWGPRRLNFEEVESWVPYQHKTYTTQYEWRIGARPFGEFLVWATAVHDRYWDIYETKPDTPKLRKLLESFIVRRAGLDVGTGLRELPQFPNTLPRYERLAF